MRSLLRTEHVHFLHIFNGIIRKNAEGRYHELRKAFRASYEQYREQCGLLIGKLKMISSDSARGEFIMASESPLKLCGYNVSQTGGLSDAARQFLLAKIIHDGVMSKLDVIHYLEHFINMNGAKKENMVALEKWCEDLDFVHKYNKSIQPKVCIEQIKKY